MAKLLLLTFLTHFFLNGGHALKCTPENLPCLPQDEWWGPTELKNKHDTSIRPFKITFDDDMIADLRQRLTNYRRPAPALEGVKFEYGFDTSVLSNWTKYWVEQYNFKEREKYFNKYPAFKTNVQGLDVFFIHVKPETVPKGKEVVPLLLLHGWPGSVREFYEAIPVLMKADDSKDYVFELIIPSLPGFGYTQSAVRPGLGAAQSAVIYNNLMKRLGFEQFYIQGGDFGAIIANYMVTMYPKAVLGYHTNFPIVIQPTTLLMTALSAVYPSLIVDPEWAHRIYPQINFVFNLLGDSGYLHEQATKPETVGIGLTDSPTNLLAYNLEKFNEYLGNRGVDSLNEVSKDSLLDHLMLYWAPNACSTSLRIYGETFNKTHFGLGLDAIPTDVPVWAIQPENDVAYIPPALLKIKFPYLVNATAINFGGHFLAFEMPDVFAADVLLAVQKFRDLRKEGKGSIPKKSLPDFEWHASIKEMISGLKNIKSNPDAQLVGVGTKYTLDAIARLLARVVKDNSLSVTITHLIENSLKVIWSAIIKGLEVANSFNRIG